MGSLRIYRFWYKGMISKIKSRVANHLVNAKGWSTDRKIVVIESDDWGSIRIPSKEAYNALLSEGIPVDNSPYCRYDSLASEEDLQALLEVLSGVKDKDNKPAVFTANAVVANPDFDRIRESGFQLFFDESIADTFQRYPNHANCLDLWREGNRAGLFHPQSHGKVHLNVPYWLSLLQQGDETFRLAFNHRFWGLSSDVFPGLGRSVQASFDHTGSDELEFSKDSLRTGLKHFEELFGYRSKSFIANNYIWSCELNSVLYEEGVRYLQGMKYQKIPQQNGSDRQMIRHYLGERNEEGQLYLIRNCSFEPALDRGTDVVDECLESMKTSFLWNKPAIITSHRLNYVGSLQPGNRAANLLLLKELLQKITKKWPDVEFMTSDQLGGVISQEHL